MVRNGLKVCGVPILAEHHALTLTVESGVYFRGIFLLHLWTHLKRRPSSFRFVCRGQTYFSLLSLKGQCHEIFVINFLFAQKNLPGPHMNRLKRFHQLFRFHEDFRLQS